MSSHQESEEPSSLIDENGWIGNFSIGARHFLGQIENLNAVILKDFESQSDFPISMKNEKRLRGQGKTDCVKIIGTDSETRDFEIFFDRGSGSWSNLSIYETILSGARKLFSDSDNKLLDHWLSLSKNYKCGCFLSFDENFNDQQTGFIEIELDEDSFDEIYQLAFDGRLERLDFSIRWVPGFTDNHRGDPSERDRFGMMPGKRKQGLPLIGNLTSLTLNIGSPSGTKASSYAALEIEGPQKTEFCLGENPKNAVEIKIDSKLVDQIKNSTFFVILAILITTALKIIYRA